MLKRVIHASFCSAVALILVTGCTKARKAEGYLDTPEVHYKQGMKYWDKGEFVKAEEEFNFAKQLDPQYALATAGLALTTAQKAEGAADSKTQDEGFRKSMELADKAIGQNDKLPEVYIARAMVKTMKFEGKKEPREWLGDVEADYNRAIERDKSNSEAYYRRGFCYKKAYEFSKSASDFRKVLDLDKGFTIEANEQWELVQKIERAAPGTEMGKRIALIEKISRADISALYLMELNVDKLITKRRPIAENTGYVAPTDTREMQTQKMVNMDAVTDMTGHWAKNMVGDIVAIGIRGLEPYPDHTFHPNDLITRGEFAMMVEDVLIAILGDKAMATKNISDEKSRYPDVNPSHPYYNAICTAVDKGVMEPALNGSFEAEKSVSGADALLTIRKIKDLNRIK